MPHIHRISHAQQLRLLDQKLEERTKLAILTDPSHPEYEQNRLVAYDAAQEDWKFAVNNFFWLQDPEAEKIEDKELPFLLYDFQEKAGDEIVKAITQGYDLPIEKCRKMGLTWLMLAIITWGWHFHEWDVLVGSRKAEEVDRRGDMGTLFQKVRFMVKRLPDWIFPHQFDNHTDKVMLLRHPRHHATIVGEGNNPDFGRSDRRKVAFLDEFTSWEQTDKAAWQGLSATTKCRIPVSTPNVRGSNAWFYHVVKDYQKKDKPTLTLGYNLHPIFAEGLRPTTEKDLAYKVFLLPETSPWLENEISRSSDSQSVAQEILINYEASMAGKVFPDFTLDQIQDDLTYQDNLPLYVGWDFGLDQTAMIFIQYDPRSQLFHVIDEYVNDGQNQGTDIYHYLDILDAKNYKSALHFGDPHSGENRSITSGQSPATILRRHGIVFKSQRARIPARVQATRTIIKRLRIAPTCILTIEMLTSWQLRRPKTGNTASNLPEHSAHSHIGEALTYFAFNFKNQRNVAPPRKKEYATSLSGVV